MNSDRETIAALATPVGTSAIAVVRVSGRGCAELATSLLGREPAPRHVQRCDYRDRDGQLLDDVLVTFFRGPHSYTGEDALEISSHGNPFIAQKILEDLLARGCRAAEPGEFTQRAFLNGQMDLSQAEAVMDLIHARSERAVAAANRQLRGALGARMNGLISRLVNVIAHIEAYIDFPEEDLPPEDAAQLSADLGALTADTGRLLATNHYHEILRDGLRTVILGAPNAGKSSLLNRLVGYDRALVSAEPGTTRDFIEERITVGPHSLRLIDTAGLNPTPGAIEAMGMAKTREQAGGADLILWVWDASLGATPALPEEIAGAREKVVLVANKVDLIGKKKLVECSTGQVIRVSALTGDGMNALVSAITEFADKFQRETGEDVVAVNARHADALRRATESLDAAQRKLRDPIVAELVASDLREALQAYGEIAGRIDNERVLDQLFASFCIGK